MHMRTDNREKGPLTNHRDPLPSTAITPSVTPSSKCAVYGGCLQEKLALARVTYMDAYLISCYVYMKGQLFFIACLTWLTQRHLGSHFKNYAYATRIQSLTRLMWHQNELSPISYWNEILSPSLQRGGSRTGYWLVSGGIMKTKTGPREGTWVTSCWYLKCPGVT